MSEPIHHITTTTRWSRVRDALGVVHDTFVEAGYQEPLPSGVRVIPSYLNPGTVFHLGTIGDRPVSCCAMLADGPLGLPSDRAFAEELDEMRRHNRLVEIGSNGILAEARAHTRHLELSAFGANARLLREAGPGTALICSVEPRQFRFYSNFGMEYVTEQERPLYGAPAILLGAPYERIMDALDSPRGAVARTVAGLMNDPSPSWWSDDRCGDQWPAEELAQLLSENGLLATMLERDRLLSPILQAVCAADATNGLHRSPDLERSA